MAKTVSITISAQDSFSAVFQKYSTAVGDAASQNERVATSTGRASTAMDDLGRNVTAAITAYAGIQGIRAVGELFQQGQQLNIVSQTFSALAESIGGAELNMSDLQTATGGVVDNMTLMQGANRLMQMGLATSGDELSRLTQMAVQLGSSMGMDAQKSFEDFSLMLANNSIVRLDQFGISSGNVRRRMGELQATMEGIDKNEAFKLAVLEEGQLALDRLGDAATAAETPLNRLQTRLTNIANQFAGNFATGANAVAGILEIAMGQNPVQIMQERQAQAEKDNFSSVYGQAFKEQAAAQGIDLLTFFGSEENVNTAINGIFEQFKTQGAGAIDYISQDLNGMAFQLSGMTDERLPATMKTVLERYIADQQAIVDAATFAASPEGKYQAYLATGGGDDRADSRAQQQAARDYASMNAYDSIANSDISQSGRSEKMKPSDITSAMKSDIAAIVRDSATAGTNLGKMADNMAKASSFTDRMQAALNSIKDIYDVKFKISADDPNGILNMITQIMGGTSLADIVRSNGGTVPGTAGRHAGQGGV